MINADHIQELHLKGETTVWGHVSLGDLEEIARELELTDHQRSMISISECGGETLKIHIPQI